MCRSRSYIAKAAGFQIVSNHLAEASTVTVLCRFAAFVGVLERASRDNLEFIKDKAIRALGKLLAAKPEQEARILAALVNKLGDPSRKLASKVSACLEKRNPNFMLSVAALVNGLGDLSRNLASKVWARTFLWQHARKSCDADFIKVLFPDCFLEAFHLMCLLAFETDVLATSTEIWSLQ